MTPTELLTALIAGGTEPALVAEVAQLVELAKYGSELKVKLEERRIRAAAHMREVRAKKQAVSSRELTLANSAVYIDKKERKKEEERKHMRASRAMRAKELPEDWNLSSEALAFCFSKGWDEPRARREAARFAEHARANGRRQVDWAAAWRLWVTSPYQKPSQQEAQPNAPDQSKSALAALRKIRADLAEREDRSTVVQLPPGRLREPDKLCDTTRNDLGNGVQGNCGIHHRSEDWPATQMQIPAVARRSG